MQVVRVPQEAASWGANARRQGRAIGFVPTMGALHEGHLALVARAKAECGAVCASVFVNPLQFNNPEDLRHYPRQLEQDRRLLADAGCDMLFAPGAESIYQDHSPRHYDLGGLDDVLEGPLRPGHFQGVVNVVERLFHYVRPDAAYFGLKDRQQLAVIPGHGPAPSPWPQSLDPQRRYFEALAGDLRKAIRDGVPLAKAVTTAGLSERANWRLFDEYNERNATAAYAELEWE